MKRKVFILALTALFIFPFTSSAAQRVLANMDSFITTGVALSGNTAFFGNAEGILMAVNADSQSEIWSYKEGDSNAVGTPAIADGNVFFAKLTGEVICLRIADGALVWKYAPARNDSLNEGLNDGVAVGGGHVYAAYTTGELRALNIKNGHVMWTYKSDQGLRTAPAYSNGLVLVGEYNGLFSMLDAKTGKRINGGGAGGAVNTPTVNGGNVYFSAWDGSVHAVQIKDVIPLWDAKVGEPITTAPVVADGMLVVGTASGKIIALNQESGAKLWEHDSQGGQITARPVVSANRVFAGTGDEKVIMLDPATGKLASEQAGKTALNTDPVFGGNKLYFVGNQQLCALD